MTKDSKKDDENLGSFYMGRMRPPPEPERTLPRGALTAAVALAFAAVLWYAYPQGEEKYTDVNVPVVSADSSDYKSKPEDPGGMDIRHQDSTVFDSLEKGDGKQAERTAPGPEEPLDKESLGLKTGSPQLNLDPQLSAPAQADVSAAEPQQTLTGVEPASGDATTTAEPSAAAPAVAAAEETAPAAAAPAPAPAGKGKVYIQLGSYRATAGAKKDWAALQKKYPQMLKGLTMRTEQIDLGKKGVFHRLQAGTLSEARAKDVCADLKKANPGGCIIVR